jgi:hypothetical protein
MIKIVRIFSLPPSARVCCSRVERSAVQQPTFGRHAAGRCATDPEAALDVGMNTVVAGCVGALVLDPQNADTCAPITRSVTARTSAMSGAITSERRDGWIAWVDMTPPSLEGPSSTPFKPRR